MIEIYEKAGFANLALEAKKEYVAALRRRQRVPPRQPRGLGARRSRWSRPTSPSWRATTTRRRRRPRPAPTTRRRCAGTAPTWARSPTTRQRAQNNFLLAELLFEDERFAEAAIEYEKTAYGYPAHAKSADAGYAALLAYAQQQKKARARRPSVPALQRSSVDSALRFAKAFPADPRAGPVLTDAAEKLYALQRRRAGARGGAAGARRCSRRPPTRSAASPGPCSRTPRSSAGAFADAEKRLRARCWR